MGKIVDHKSVPKCQMANVGTFPLTYYVHDNNLPKGWKNVKNDQHEQIFNWLKLDSRLCMSYVLLLHVRYVALTEDWERWYS